jgi:hypothetical protein
VPWKTRFFYGFIDFMGITPNLNHAIILDHKTHGKSDQNAAAVDTQTSIYTYLNFLRYPALRKIQTGGVYIPDEDIDMATFTRDNFSEVEEKALSFFSSVLTAALSGAETGVYPAGSGRHCRWCGYTTGCEAGQAWLAKNNKGRK